MAYFSKLSGARRALLDTCIKQNIPAQINALQAMVRIPSVKAEPVVYGGRTLPFGMPMQEVLDYVLRLAHNMGFVTRDLDGYAGVIEYGAGAETLAILAHLDVVPAGEGWSLPPFSGEVHNGRIYGRGTSDDKGPAVHALYALAAIVAACVPLRRKVQIILGCDEESGSSCVEYFKKMEPAPTLAFSPDAMYPLVYAEKHGCHATYHLDAYGSSLRIHCGERANVVPGLAEAFLPGIHTSVPVVDGLTVQLSQENAQTRLTVQGLSAHASTPELGKNALQGLLQALTQLSLEPEDARRIRILADALGMDLHGERLGLDRSDESGRLTLNTGLLRWDANGASITFDSRVPLTMPVDDVQAALSTALAPAGFTLEAFSVSEGHMVPKEGELVEGLMGVYRAQTGDTGAQPLAIGGGTYARAFNNAVAFGCEWPGEPLVAHMPDEYITLESIEKNTRMMADAIIALAGDQSLQPE